MKPLLSIKNLNVYFKSSSRKLYALSDINLILEEKETLAIVGESGSGKSLLVKTIMGLNPKRVSVVESGTILYQGVDLLKCSEAEMRTYRGKKFGMIFQDAMVSLNPTMRVGEGALESYLLHHKNAKKEDGYKKVIELFTLTGIVDPEKCYYLYPHQLSGGMRQRVVIATALAPDPKILIADEPTTSLDVTLQAQILDLLKLIQEKLGMSIIFITHDLTLASHFCSKIIVMYGGKIVESGKVNDLFQKPAHPYTKRLIESIPHLTLDRNKELIPIEGSPPSLHEMHTGCSFYPRCNIRKKECLSSSPPLFQLQNGSKAACWHYETTS